MEIGYTFVDNIYGHIVLTIRKLTLMKNNMIKFKQILYKHPYRIVFRIDT